MAIKTFCDICNHEITDDDRRFRISFYETDQREPVSVIVLDTSVARTVSLSANIILRDVCMNCNDALREYIHNRPNRNPKLHLVT